MMLSVSLAKPIILCVIMPNVVLLSVAAPLAGFRKLGYLHLIPRSSVYILMKKIQIRGLWCKTFNGRNYLLTVVS